MRVGDYPGDCPAKRLIRQELYFACRRAWDISGRPGGYAVILAGPNACEIQLLRDYLRWPKNRVIVVDLEEEGLIRARHLWPGVETHKGPVHRILRELPTVGFLNLDLMGYLTTQTEVSFYAAAGNIMPNGIVSFTFYRGREHPTHKTFPRLLESGSHVLEDDQLTDTNLVRWVGTAYRIQAILELRSTRIVMTEDYRSPKSAMGIYAIQNGPWDEPLPIMSRVHRVGNHHQRKARAGESGLPHRSAREALRLLIPQKGDRGVRPGRDGGGVGAAPG